MNIDNLVTSQFRRFMTSPIKEPKCVFERLVYEFRKQVEAGMPFNTWSQPYLPHMVAESGYQLNEFSKKETQVIESLIKEELEKYGLLHSMLNEQHEAKTIEPGKYSLSNGTRFELNAPLLPCDEFLGYPIYKHGDLRFTYEQVHHEDAPVNAVGHGNIAGVSPGQEPPGKSGLYLRRNKKKTKELKRKL